MRSSKVNTFSEVSPVSPAIPDYYGNIAVHPQMIFAIVLIFIIAWKLGAQEDIY